MRLALAGAVLGGTLALAGPASADTQTFGYTGGEQTFVVPQFVTSVQVDAVGAAGGGNGLLPGVSAGATVTGTIAVTPGEVLYIEVGGFGHDGGGTGDGFGGWNGGGNGGVGDTGRGGGGGGASDVRTISCGAGCPGSVGSLNSRLLVAAGGGGAGAVGTTNAGGAGGDAGQDGLDGHTDLPAEIGGGGGGGAGQPPGGAAGAAGSATTGNDPGAAGIAGLLGEGGPGAHVNSGGGGGGAGVFGGGGGGGGGRRPPSTGVSNDEAGGGGGGGGSSLGTPNGLALPGTPASVTLTWTPNPPPTPQPPPTPIQPPTVKITKPANGAKFVKGQRIRVAYTCIPGTGSALQSCSGPVATGGTLKVTKTGTFSFKVTAANTVGMSASQTVSYKVIAPKQKTGYGVTVKLGKLTLHGTLVGDASTPVTKLPFSPCDLTQGRQCPVGTGKLPTHDAQTLRVRGKVGARVLAAMRRRLTGKSVTKTGTLTIKTKGTDGSSVTQTYDLVDAFIDKIQFPSTSSNRPKGEESVVTIAYAALKTHSCTPKDSC